MLFIDSSSIDGVTVTDPPELVRTNRILAAPDINEYAKDVLVGQCTFAPHCKSDLHTHNGLELIYVLSGKGKCRVGDEETDLIPDRLITIPPGVVHDFENTVDGELRLLFIFNPAEKAADIYNRALEAAQKQK